MHMWIYMCTYVNPCKYIYMYIHRYIYIRVFPCTYTHTHTHTHLYQYKYIRYIYVCGCVFYPHTHPHAPTRTHTTHTHTLRNTHVHICLHIGASFPPAGKCMSTMPEICRCINGVKRHREVHGKTRHRERCESLCWWVLQHCTGFARLVWGRLRVHWAFIYSDWFVCSVCFCETQREMHILGHEKDTYASIFLMVGLTTWFGRIQLLLHI